VRIFLDANVLFSAAKSDGFVRRLLELLLADGHVLCADGYVLRKHVEISRRKARRDCLPWPPCSLDLRLPRCKPILCR
jgi:hypothetical protein